MGSMIESCMQVRSSADIVMKMFPWRTWLSAVAIILCSGWCIAAPDRKPLDRPNILLFLADDMGYGDLESYGHPSQESGPIDQMAREGLKFNRWYSPDVLCSPSRGAMLTGRLPVRVGLYGPARVFEMSTSYGLPKSEVTIAEMLKEQGYYTGMVGKWHQGINEFSHNDGNHLPHHHGFDFVGHLIPFTNHWGCDETKTFMESPDRYYCLLYYNDSIIQQPLSHRNLTQRLVEDAKSFIFDHQDNPFFFYFSFPQLHADMFSSPRFSGSSKRGRFGDSLNEMSWAVGETMSAIREADLERNTVVIFLSDHGPQMEICSEGGSAGILKGSKDTTWEGGIRVPAIARWPGIIAPGSHSQAIVSSMDIFATAAELSGGKLPQDRTMDSTSFLPVLTGESTEHRTVLFHYCSDRLMAVTYDVFKAHLYTKPSKTTDQLASKCRKGWIPTGPYHLCFLCDPPCAVRHDPPLLYNIGKDPSELSPLNVMKHLDVIQEISRIVEEHHRTLVKGEPLFIREQIPRLNPCCNPPYCMCNYDRTVYLQELAGL